MPAYEKLIPPATGEKISRKGTTLTVPDHPVIPFIEGDGTGPDIWHASRIVFDAAVARAYGARRKVVWFEVFAGEKANQVYGPNTWLHDDTLEAIREYIVAIKGPLTTPVGGGIRSINVTLRQLLDLYVCLRPVHYFAGVPSPVRHPELIDMVIFRENTEDIYAGIEWKAGTPEAAKVIRFLREEMGSEENPVPGHLLDRHQAGLAGRDRAARACSNPVRARQQAAIGDAGAQRKHHEVHGRGVPGLGLRTCEARVLRYRRLLGRVRGECPGGEGAHQGCHRRRIPPADPDAPRRVRRDRHA